MKIKPLGAHLSNLTAQELIDGEYTVMWIMGDDKDDDFYLPSDWQNPEWDNVGRVHEWKNYVSDEIADMWETFTDNQKRPLPEMPTIWQEKKLGTR